MSRPRSYSLHHFDDATNRDLMQRVARALRPRGVVVVQDIMRYQPGNRGEQAGALGDLHFANISAAGTYGYLQIASWPQDAGLRPRPSRRFFTYLGVGQQVASEPA